MAASRPAGHPRPRRIGVGLATRVAAVLLLALAVSIDVLILVASGLRQVDHELEEITEQQVPTLLRVEALLRESQRLVSLAPELVTAREALTFNALSTEVDAIERRTTAILTALDSAPGLEAAEIESLGALSAALTARLRDLLEVVERRLRVEQRRLLLRERLSLLGERLRRATVAATAGGSRDPTCLVRWHAALAQGITGLLDAAVGQAQSQLDEASARFAQARRALAADSACALAQLPAATAFDPAAMQAEILALGEPDGLLALERERVRLRQQLGTELGRARWHGEDLLAQTERLFAATRAQMQTQGRATRELLGRRLLLLILTPLVLLAVTLGVYWYLSHALLRPIAGLRAALRTASAGGTPRFPAAGRDEVGAIIDACRETLAALATRERELKTATAAAERASHAKGTFLAHMSHELRTPLNAILGFAELLHGRHPSADERRDWSASILRSGRHLKRLIDDSLDLAAIEAGRVQIAPRDVDLAALIDEIADSLEHRAREKGLAFEVMRADDLPRHLRLDPHRLRQVLLNLLGNALKYTERGTVRLTAETVTDAARAPRLRLAVEDTGPGIPVQAHGRLFEPYEQLRPGQPGSGLGLAITRDLVKLMGGEIRVDSDTGRGSIFSVELPAIAARPVAPEAASPVAITGYRGPRRRLLVVDDSATNRLLVTEQLARLGFWVDEAAEPGTAAAIVAGNAPDLVLMDLAMPGWCGYAGAHAVRTACARPDLPVILVSATPLAHADARTLGFVTALLKPLRTEDLLDAIGRVLDLAWMAAPAPPGRTSDAADQAAPQPPDAEAWGSSVPAPDDAALLAPIRLEIEAALDLAAAARREDLQEWCSALADGDPALAPFAARARGFVAAGDWPGLRNWLQRWL
jgi:signal transduction histidine kinase/ActR/RegA family two-component response regulator